MYDEAYLQETLKRAFEDEEFYNVPRGIMRYDYSHMHGWWVRISRDKAKFSKMFYDGQCGSIQEALTKAILHRHEVLSNFPVTIKHISRKHLPLEAERRTKLIKEKGNKQLYIAWEATWYDKDHIVHKKAFSVRQFGHEEAKAMALETARANHNKKPKISKVPDLYEEQVFKPISRSDVEVLATINSAPYSGHHSQIKATIENNPFAFEGERKLELHRKIERDRTIRAMKVSSFLEEREQLFCEVCHFSFLDTYSFLFTDIIEVHHLLPLAKLSSKTKTTLADLMLLCSNFHFAIHQGNPKDNLLSAMEFFEELREKSREQKDC